MAETKLKEIKKPEKVEEPKLPVEMEEPVEVDVVKISAENPGHISQDKSSPVNVPIKDGNTTTDTSTRSIPTDAVNKEIGLKTENQRQINLIWESTQQKIAFFAIGVAVLVAAALCFVGNDQGNKTAAFVFLTGQASLITGFYFGRTNHQRTGGVGGANESSR